MCCSLVHDHFKATASFFFWSRQQQQLQQQSLWSIDETLKTSWFIKKKWEYFIILSQLGLLQKLTHNYLDVIVQLLHAFTIIGFAFAVELGWNRKSCFDFVLSLLLLFTSFFKRIICDLFCVVCKIIKHESIDVWIGPWVEKTSFKNFNLSTDRQNVFKKRITRTFYNQHLTFWKSKLRRSSELNIKVNFCLELKFFWSSRKNSEKKIHWMILWAKKGIFIASCETETWRWVSQNATTLKF